MGRYTLTGNRDIDAVLRGIEELDSRYANDSDIRCAQIRELASALFGEEADAEKASKFLPLLKPSRHADDVNHIHGVAERIVLCREFTQAYTQKSADSNMDGCEKTVAILNNGYMQEAFDKLCSKFNRSAVYCGSFEEMCENVGTESYDYAIVPIENSENGKLLRFYTLIGRYDLKINAVCDISYSDGSATTRYALVSKSVQDTARRADCFEFSVSLDHSVFLNDILLAASLCSMKLQRIDSVEIPYKDKEFSFYLVFDIEGADADSFMLYMSLDFPQYIPVGIFEKIE